MLPPYYTTVWFAGVPYYYANDTYYTYAGPQGYEVVEPPDGSTPVEGPQPRTVTFIGRRDAPC